MVTHTARAYRWFCIIKGAQSRHSKLFVHNYLSIEVNLTKIQQTKEVILNHRRFIDVLCFYFRNSSKDMITTHKEPVMCVKYNKSFKHVVTASESSVI